MNLEQQSKSQEHQLQRQFQKQEFVTVVNQLISSMKINHCFDVSEMYDKIKIKKGKVVGKDIVDTIQQYQQLNEQQRYISEQIQFYREQINKLILKGITCITILEFDEYFTNNFVDGIITNEIQKKIKNYDYISLAKLIKVIDKIQEEKNKFTNKSSFNISNLNKSHIYRESYFQTMQQLNVNIIIQYINEGVLDAGIRNNIKGMLFQIQKKINSLEQNNIDLQQVENTLRNSLQQFDDELHKNYKIVDQKQGQIDRLKIRVKQLQQQVIDLNKQYQEQVVNYIKNMEIENNKLRKQLLNTSIKNQQYKTKLDWFKTNYYSLTKQYEQFVIETKAKNQKQKQQKQQKMFIQRTIKQQLEDSLAKITILRNQNIQLKQKNSDLIFIYQNKITSMEQKINQHQNNKQNQSHDFIKFQGNNSTFRNSRLDRTSRISIHESSKFVDKNHKQSQIPSQINSSLLNLCKSNNFQSKFKKKPSQIIPLQQSIIMSQLIDENMQQQQQQQTKQIKQQLQNTRIFDKKKNTMSSMGFIITSQGNRSPCYFNIYQDRFCFFVKGKIDYQIQFKNLSKIVFCYYNASWIVLKVKPQQFSKKKQKICDKVLSIINRQDILQFLHLKCWKVLLAEQVKIKFEEEERVWVITKQNTQVLLSNFNNAYNLNRISITNAGFIFEAGISEGQNSWFGQDTVSLIVSNIGILVFEKDSEYLLQKNQKLQKIIPIVQFMTIQNPNRYEIIIRYKTQKKIIYKLKLPSIFLTKKLKNQIDNFYQQILITKKKQLSKYSLFIDGLDKGKKKY